jgi:hypothetical protein
MAQIGFSQPFCCQFWHQNGQCLPKNITVDVLDNKIDLTVEGFYFSMFYKVLAASRNAMVSDESGVRR